MYISDVTVETVRSWGNIELDEDDEIIRDLIMPSARAYLRDYTGLDDIQLEEREGLAMAFVSLCVFLYDNRSLSIQNEKQNAVVRSFLDLHRVNLLA